MQRMPLWTKQLFIVIALAVALLAFAACDSSTESDGDQPDGDTPDGDADGDEPDGDTPDGDMDSRCPAGMEYDEDSGRCLPKKKECAENFKLNETTGMCVPMNEWDYALLSCSSTDMAFGDQQARYYIEEEGRWWEYTGYGAGDTPTDMLKLFNYKALGGPGSPGDYAIGDAEASLATCAVCIVLSTDCDADGNCAKTYMPSGNDGGVVTFERLDNGNEGIFSGTLKQIELREVTIGADNKTTPVEGGETRCLQDLAFNGQLPSAGFVDMDPPEGLSCDYPEGPYHFIGPEPNESDPEPGTVPPMSWPGAYIGGERVGFNLAQYRCDHPEIKTLFIMTSAGWCPACRTFYGQMVCPEGELEDQLHALQAEILYVVGDTNTPGDPASNAFADEYMDGKGCRGGIRISDTDNTAKKRVIWYTQMSTGIPWVSVIRMSDMKLIYEQGDRYYLPFTQIAQDVIDEEAANEE